MDLVKILDLNKFQLREDKFKLDEKDKCKKSVSWEKLKVIKNPKEYIEILNHINTNPKYEIFNQLYFHAGDEYQFQKYGFLKSRLLSYPKTINNEKYGIYNNYNLNSTYNTFKYLFDKVKKGVYVSIRNNKLDVFLPFSNIGYKNNWSEVLEKLNPGLLNYLKNLNYNVSDPSHWYANNCILNMDKVKYTSDGAKHKGGKEYVQEGDKTEVPFKNFLLNFLKDINKNKNELNDIDFFFSPRDFPVHRQGYLEPYVNLLGNEKLEEEYIHDIYTPILSQCGKDDFYDIPIPTEDDMMRITKDIYPDDCKNNYNKKFKFNMDFSSKKNMAVFRGSCTGCGINEDTNMRLNAAYLSIKYKLEGKNILDAKLTGWNNKPKVDLKRKSFGKIKLNNKNEYIAKKNNKNKWKRYKKDIIIKAGYKDKRTNKNSNFMDLEEQSNYKYILNIDGHVKAFRLGNELRMGSVILLVDSPYKLWFQDMLKPGIHYIPIKSDLSDLEKQINWCNKNELKCSEIAEKALDFYEKYLSKEGTYKYFYNLLNNLSKIRREPIIKKISNNKLNIIVAYRNHPNDNTRKIQLEIFKEQISKIFNGITDYHIYVIEQESEREDYDKLSEELKQEGSKMAKFNLGMLKNIGFQLANKENNKIKNAYYVLSDVDLLPSNELIEEYLRYPNNPIHLGNKGTRYNLDGKDDDNFLGGVLSVNKDDFIKCNGYPNNFWGWGGEDNALLNRLNIKKMKIDRPEYPVIDLEDMDVKEKMIDLKKRENIEQKKWEKLCSDSSIFYEKYKNEKEKDGTKIDCQNLNNWESNGLNNLEGLYKIISEEHKGGGNSDNISHYKVYLNNKSDELENELEEDKDILKKKLNEYKKLKLEDLYEEYYECEKNININKNIKLNKNKQNIIRRIIDNKDLDDKQLEELNKRDYLSYPDYNNPNFINDISKKVEFNINKITLNKEEVCNNKEFELANHQRLLKNFINNETPYKSLLLFHGVGVGKTCSGVSISESFRDIYVRDNSKIIIVRKSGLSQGWKDTIFDPEKGDNQCSGHEFIDTFKENIDERDPNSVRRAQNKLIKKYYEFYQYGTFSSKIKEILGNIKDNDEELIKIKINKYFSNRLLIIDEYHNLRQENELLSQQENNDKKEEKKALKNLYKVIKYSNNLRIIFLTATPMFNNAKEIFLLINLMLLNDGRPLINEKEYINNEGDITKKGKDLINKKCRGYISYLRGENPINFPLRLYPNKKDKLTILPDKAPKNNLFGDRIENPLRFLITYKNELEGQQKKIYEKYLKKLISEKDPNKEKKLGINKYLPQICNIVYPSKKGKKGNDYGEKGFKEIFELSGKKYKYKKNIEKLPILSRDNIQQVSIKFKNIIKNIESSEGIIFIYTDYIWAGALPLGIALEHIGFNKYNDKNLLNYKGVEEPLNYDMKKLKDKKDFKQANYIILSGNDNISGNDSVRDSELKILKSEENKNGELIKVVIGSSVTGEGIDFKNIREIHVLDPWYHLNKLEQIIGRGIRFCSHSMLEKEKRNVTVFLHTTTFNNNETIDHYNYRRGEKKSIEIGEIEVILKQNALDSYLFKEGNIIKKKDVTPVKIKTSKRNDIKVEIYDKPYTKICSFQNECDYKCINVDKKVLDKLNEDTLNYDTYNNKYFNDIDKKIINYINELFQKKNYYSLDEIIEHIQYHKDINKFIIYNSIKNIIDYKETIYDINKNKGYIISRGNYYIFQPLFNNDESIPMFYRSTKVNTKNSININNINIEYPEEHSENTIIPESDVKKIIKELFVDYSKFKKDTGNILGNLYLFNNKYKKIYCEYLLDKLSYNDRNIYIRYLLENDLKNIQIKNGELTEKEFHKIAYNYLSNQFIYNEGNKRILFKSKGEPIGYFIMNENKVIKQTKKLKKKEEIVRELGKSIEYYKKNEDNTYSMIEPIKGDLIINTSKTWTHSYWNNSNKSIIKIVIGDNLGKEVDSSNVSKEDLIGYIKNNIKEKEFNKLNISILSKYSKKNLCKTLEIIFRIKNFINEDINYFVKFDLLYHKLK